MGLMRREAYEDAKKKELAAMKAALKRQARNERAIKKASEKQLQDWVEKKTSETQITPLEIHERYESLTPKYLRRTWKPMQPWMYDPKTVYGGKVEHEPYYIKVGELFTTGTVWRTFLVGSETYPCF